jgi:predicted RND superfamily exporter protein
MPLSLIDSLEAICFSILIGISCDFVIHFTHAYASLPGDTDRHVRTKFAVIRMGPSILAAAFTTIAAATIMLFTVISFFVKFAVILFATVVQASVGSFIVFVALADAFGPSQPTYAVDWITAKLIGN